MKGALRVLVLLTGSLLVVVGWSAFLTPMHVTVAHGANWVPRLRVDGIEHRFAAHPVASVYRVSITNISGDASTVELALPIPDGQPRLRFDELESVAGRWEVTSHGERLESTQPGSEITIVFTATEPEIPFLNRPDGGRVRVRYDGTEREIDLRSASPDWHRVRLPPRQLVSAATLGSRPLGARFEVLADGTGNATGAILLGAKSIVRKFEVSAGDPLSLVLSSAEIVPLVLEGIGDFGALLGWSVLAILTFTLAGSSLAASDPRAVLSRSDWIAGFAIGFSLFALVANTSAYFFSANASAPILGGLLLAAAAAGAAGRAKSASALARGLSPGHLPVAVVVATALGLWLSFWPLTFAGPGFLGTMRADSYFYTTVANAIQSKPLFSAIANEGLIGNGMRSIDLALAASLSSISGLPAGRTWLVICMALMIVPPLASYYLVRDWLQSRRVAVLAAMSVALSAPIASLFFESYLVQYVTTAALYLNLYTALPFVRSLEQASPAWRTTFAHALTSAFVLLLYPYFAVVPLATAGAAMWLLRKDRARLFRHVGLLFVTGLAVGNVGYFFMFNHAATGQFVDELNRIARYVVFPFYNQPTKFAAFVLGLAPFHASAEVLRNLMAETTANGFASAMAGYVSIVERRAVFAVLALIGSAYLACLAGGRKRLLDGFGLVLPASLFGYLLLLFVAWHFSGVYATCKLAWTLATLLPLILVPVLASAVVRGVSGEESGGRRWAPVRALAAGALCLFLTGNLISKAAGPVFWIANPGTLTKADTSLAADLAMLDAWHPSGVKPATRFAFADASGAALPSSQSSSALAGHVYSSLVGRGYACINCDLSDKLLQFTWFRVVDVRTVDADLLVMTGTTPQSAIPGWVTTLRGERLTIYLRQAR